jgi:Tfp pilus assembly protein PilN
MKAVNLIPADQRRGGSGGNGRSGGMVHVLLGSLAALLVAALAFAIAGKAVDDRRAELAEVRSQADAVQAQADDLRAYVRFAELRAKRVDTVNQLVASRFDWAHSLHEIARVIPQNAWLTSMKGTRPASSTGAAGAPGAPSVEVGGCTTSQGEVARMMTRMRLIDGVEGVRLSSSQKGGCGTSDKLPAFQMVVSFRAPAAAPAPTSPSTANAGASR